MKYRIICIIAALVIFNIVCIPFVCNKYWSISNEDISQDAQSFSDMIENLREGYSSEVSVPIDGLYYFGGLACALFIFISALRKSSGACILGSTVGIGLCLYIFYQINLGTTRWYVGLHEARLTFGYYISCAGFIFMLITSSNKKLPYPTDSKKIEEDLSGQWYCYKCGSQNDADYQFCASCGQHRDKLSRKSAGGTWTCKCGNINEIDAVGCPICGRRKISISQVNTWACSCGEINETKNAFCPECGRPQKSVAVAASAPVSDSSAENEKEKALE